MTNLCKNSKFKGEDKQGEGEPATPDAWEQIYPIEKMREALEATISQIIKIQKENLGPAAEPNDLNIAFTNGKSLVACRFRNHATEQPPSLYYSTSAGVTLNRLYPDHPDGANGPHGAAKGSAEKGVEGHNPQAKKGSGEHGNHVIIASEPSTYKNREWTLIEKNRVVMVENGEGIRIEELRV
jgi:glutamine amidotransferase